MASILQPGTKSRFASRIPLRASTRCSLRIVRFHLHHARLDRSPSERLRGRRLQLAVLEPRRDRAFHSRHIPNRRHSLLPDRDHRIAGGYVGRAAQSRRAKEATSGRRGHGSFPSGRPLHFPRRRTARRASRAMGPAAGFRRVPALPGSRAREHPSGDSFAGMARGAALHRSSGAGRCGGRASATPAPLRAKSPTL